MGELNNLEIWSKFEMAFLIISEELSKIRSRLSVRFKVREHSALILERLLAADQVDVIPLTHLHGFILNLDFDNLIAQN